MDINAKLQGILGRQKDLAKEFEGLIGEFDLKNILTENENLKISLENYRKNIEEVKLLADKLKDENNGLRVALREQIFDEKFNILRISRQKIDTYFEKVDNEYHSSLYEFENYAKTKLLALGEVIRNELAADADFFDKELNNLTNSVKLRIQNNNQEILRQRENISNETNNAKDKLLTKEISEEVVQKRIKQNNLEFKIGLNWVNKIGILLILIGISSGIKYTYSTYFLDEFKAAFVFLIGLLLLGGGEYFIRKNKEIFALGLSGGGIGVLYLGAYHSYFNLNVIPLETAMIVAVAITSASFVLTLRYDSPTIASLSLAGGFLPFFTYAYTTASQLTSTFIYVSMGYLLILNLLTLMLSLTKKWDIVKYLSFILNVPSMCFLVFNTDNHTVAILYSILTFGMYLVTSLSYPFRYKVALKPLDTLLLSINTAASCIIIYSLFEVAKLSDYRGALAILFCLTYFGLGHFADKYLAKDKNAIAIFYLTSFAFAVLAVPFQLGLKWFAMGWLIEAVIMIILGYKNKIKYLEIGGWVVLGLCVGSVLTIDFSRYELLSDTETVPHFHLRYLFVITGMIMVLYTYLIDFSRDKSQKYSTRGMLIRYYKYFVVLNLWVFGLYMSNSLMAKIIIPQNLIESYYNGFAYKMLYVLVTLLVAYLLMALPLIKDKIINMFSNFLFVISVFILVILNFAEPIFVSEYDNFRYFALSVLLMVNVLTFLNLKYLIIQYIKINSLSIEVLPIGLCLYLLFNITGILVYQFNLGEINMLYSIIYIISALGCVIFGFVKQYISTRRFGLGLAVFALAKLFLFDLSNLLLGGKIISYICFGVTLLGISFMYQKFSKSTEPLQFALLKDEKQKDIES